MEIRNIAIIAHVDHGKTSLTDALMRQTGAADAGVSMDSNDLEKERGITIYSKNTSIFYKETKINIVDTPGHVDFGSEVERVLRSIDAVILVVDSQEGPMPQTKFVLKKSLELGLKPIVVINKIDKEAARPKWVHEKLVELFIDLGADDSQIEFPVIYAIAREGIAKKSLDDPSGDLTPLLDLILKQAPLASGEELNKKELKVQPFNLAYDDFMGRLAICRIYQGAIHPADKVYVKKTNGEARTGRIAKVFTFQGLERREVNEACAGDIVMLAGLPDIYIGETICAEEDVEALPAIKIDEPTISLNFLVNNSPFMGKEGSKVTTRQIKERLEKELEVNVGLKVDFSAGDYFKVYGRGELHIAILLENMRRAGYELQVSQPQVILKEENGVSLEPFEELTLTVPNNAMGTVIEKLSQRKGAMVKLQQEQNYSQMIFEIPTRGLLGYRGEFVIDTKGEGILYSQVIGFRSFVGEIRKRKSGAMISMAQGVAVAYALYNLQERGSLYIGAGAQVYPGMVIGNTSRGDEMTVNPTKGKHLTNVRAKGAEEALILTPPLVLTIERGLEIMNNDEYLEITPQSARLRKKILTEIGRIREKRKK